MPKTAPVLALLIAAVAATNARSEPRPMMLWYRQPARAWTEALPIGNGRMGAMVYGGIQDERLQLNEDTLYAGEPGPVGVVPVHRYVDQVFALLQQGKDEEATRLVDRNLLGRNHQTYTTMGNLRLAMAHQGEATDYRRELDLAKALARATYRLGGARHTREVFATAADQVIVIRLTCDKAGRVSFDASLDTPHAFARLAPEGKDGIALSAKLPMHACNRTIAQIRRFQDTHKYPDLFHADGRLKVNAAEDDKIIYARDERGRGMTFEVRLHAMAEGGRIQADQDGLHVSGADAVTLLLAADTSFNGFDSSPTRHGVDPSIQCAKELADAARPYAQLLGDHVAGHRSLFDRVRLDLGSSRSGDLPTDERLRRFGQTGEPSLAALYFQFGRYLLISSSLPGSQAANLQGIWCEAVHAPWNGGYTTNINTEMNYWPAEVANLAECTEPLLRLITECAVNGRKTAEGGYRCRGWVAHHNVSIWRITDPVDNQARFSFWPMAGGWLCRHLWDHYLFSGDRDFLAGRAYPLMKGAAEFYLDWLREDGRGRLVTPISTSPELGFRTPDGRKAAVSMGSTMDIGIIRELFTHCMAAAKELNVDPEFRAELQAKLPRLLPFQIGTHGQLQEWYKDWDDPGEHHRHLSHLYGLFPGDLITPRGTPKLAAAARKSLDLRGPGNVGWSKAWKYYFLASGCTGYAPNAARSAVADSIWGPWKELGNPCVGTNPTNGLGPEKTFGAQSTFILPVQGREDAFIAMFDIWRVENQIDARHAWLPMRFDDAGFKIEWMDEWDLAVFDRTASTTGGRDLAPSDEVGTQLPKIGAAFGTIGAEVTSTVRLGGHTCQVWRIRSSHAIGTRYRVSLKHAAAGDAGAFYLTAWADRRGDGTPDTRIGTSRLCRAGSKDEWSSWDFETKHKRVFVGNCWEVPPTHYYQTAGYLAGYVGLSSTVYFARSRAEPPTSRTGPRYTNIRVEVMR